MMIPHRQLSPEALQGLIEEFVTREGTDYGECEIPLQSKVVQVRKRLDNGSCVIFYDPEDGGITLLTRDQASDPLGFPATL